MDRKTNIELMNKSELQVHQKQEIQITNGLVACSNMTELIEFAKLMSSSGVAIPKHLRNDPGACLAICIQAFEWGMSAFPVANKSYSVNDRLGYEAQLINAVILRRAPIVGRFACSYSGEKDARRCKVSVEGKDGVTYEYESPPVSSIPVKNSPLWKGDTDQQLFFYSSRALCRRHFPDVILGVYTQDELSGRSEEPKVTVGRVVTDNPLAKKYIEAQIAEEETPDPVVDPEVELRKRLISSIKNTILEHDFKMKDFPPLCVTHGLIAEGSLITDAPTMALEIMADNALAIMEGTYGNED